MNAVERHSFDLLRDEMRDGFTRVENAVDKMGARVHSLELTRAEQAGDSGSNNRRRADDKWRIGLVVGVLVSLAGTVIHIILELVKGQ